MMVPEDDIPAFADPMKWLSYFPPWGKVDLAKFGVCTDWRRSFITTSINPFYDAFIRWQFRLLKERGRVKFGKRPNVFSPRDGQVRPTYHPFIHRSTRPSNYLPTYPPTHPLSLSPSFSLIGLRRPRPCFWRRRRSTGTY